MKPINLRTLFVVRMLMIFSITILQYSCSSSGQEVEDEREFDYMKWSEKGPRHWGKLKKEWSACDNGDFQSPIDLSNRRVKVVNKLRKMKMNTTYLPSNGILKNRGHDISLYWAGNAGSLFENGVVYDLQQSHWHSPSEHSINGRRYELELHMVHLSSDTNLKNKIAVVGQLYKIGKPDPFLSKLTKEISSMVDQKKEIEVGVIDPNEIRVSGRNYYRYLGSLTVPPCTEGVIWTINKKIKTVSREQVKLLREAVHDYAELNARPLQPLNSREIHLFCPNS